MKNIAIFWILNILLVFTTNAQSNSSFKDKFLSAEYYFIYEEYSKALPIYLSLGKSNPDNANINYKIGTCYLNISGAKALAISYYENAVKKITTKYKDGSYKEESAPEVAYYRLGEAYHKNNEFDKAIVAYTKFKDFLNVKDIYNIDIVERQIETCKIAKNLIKYPVMIVKNNLGNIINTPYSDYNPVVSGDETILIFTSKQKFLAQTGKAEIIGDYNNKIFFVQKTDGEWGKARDISKEIDTDGYAETVYLSNDGMHLFLMQDEYFDGNIYESEYQNGKWSPMKKLNKNINSKYWEMHVCLSPDNKTLYFSSDRKGGYGGFDIYKSEKDELGEWGSAVNLGSAINTKYDDDTPFILSDGKSLYFSSEGHYCMGGFDVFYSRLMDNEKWSSPLNLGYPVNSADDNLFFYPVKNGEYTYFASASKQNAGTDDLFLLKLTLPDTPGEFNISGTISLQDRIFDPSENIKVKIAPYSRMDSVTTIEPDNDGNYDLRLVTGSYVFQFEGDNYKTTERNVFIPNILSRTEFAVNAEMIPVSVLTAEDLLATQENVSPADSALIAEQGTADQSILGKAAIEEYFVIKSIYFDFNSHYLNREAQIELERLSKIMEVNAAIQLEVIGHTDAVGSASYNKKLSEKRSHSVVDYLINKGVGLDRFVVKGAGEEDHIAININTDGSDNPEGRKYNRRVEMKVLKGATEKVVVEDIFIPEYIQFKRDVKYHVLLSVAEQALVDGDFDKLKENSIDSIITHQADAKFIYSVGTYKKKFEAVKLLHNIIDLGFEDAYIINNFELKKLIAQGGEDDATKSLMDQIDLPKYKIQLSSFKKPANLKKFKNVGLVDEIKFKGFYIYTYGNFNGYSSAKEELIQIRKKGYPDAFIIRKNRYKSE